MKHFIWNTIWLIAFTVASFIIIEKLDKANSKCVSGITRIENRLDLWELSN